ncbi:dTDP-4-dehydrorhamnose 3,5-epimerase [Paenibacillus cellulosilyticus]|uniref:dTDP-4-dehydrorhamnose 3,5-epimerase n=1 Tax=Paenibacillus cellulosilyticus TaxID=375489 RepID=A0A2V2YL41_9BACL|nr:dTDP-4-dehydrorhamnose 3,5-epimerase [Paenibacillus cellulosilyticus]PWV93810.1 dTDP-4-dehydrorhamnose 3,5-epimerase [Paenibacillus cellulosilyticus]QKS47425.1 dTDP-4-dehydrorhamnose 3,5-epimerase [Paenibacillus cellulosilyticus]
MKIIPTKLDGVLVIETDVFGDHRGFFTESYNEEKFKAAGVEYNFIQDNHSLSSEAGTVRGLHFQLAPKAQTKLVRVAAGAIYDVAVDLRGGSSTYGQWVGVILSESNKRQLLVPKGFAHGFCTLTPNTQVMYKVDEYYSREHDHGILWNDPDIGIDWPTDRVVLSDKDKVHPGIREAGIYF